MICHTKAWIQPEKGKWVRELRIRFVFHPHHYNTVALSLWPRTAYLPPCFSFSHQFRAAAKYHTLWSAPWESYSSLHCWQKKSRETSPFPKRSGDNKPLCNPSFASPNRSVAPEVAIGSSLCQRVSRGGKNKCTRVHWHMDKNSLKLFRCVITRVRGKKGLRKALFALRDTVSSDCMLWCFSQCLAQGCFICQLCFRHPREALTTIHFPKNDALIPWQE